MVVEGKKGVNQGFSIVKALLLTKIVSDKRDICAIIERSSVYKHVKHHENKMKILKKYIFFLIGVMIITSCKKKQSNEISIIPEIDERVELMSVLARIADYEEYNDSTYINYVKKIEDHFGEFTNSKAVATLQELREITNLAYDGIMKMAVNLNIEADLIRPIEDVSMEDSRWPPEIEERFYDELTEFYVSSNFKKWFQSNEEIYGHVLLNAQHTSDINRSWFNEYFGYKNPHEFKLILGPGNGYGNYGPAGKINNKEVIYAIVGVGDIDSIGNPIFYPDEFNPTVVHEFLHSFINPFTKRNYSDLELSANKIYNSTSSEMNRLAYGDGETVINESLVRASVIQYMGENGYQEDEIIFEHIYNKKIGFYWISDLVSYLDKYKVDRSQYPEFSKYSTEISKFFATVAHKSNMLNQNWEDQKAIVEKTNPRHGDIINYTQSEISFTLNQPLLIDYFGFGPAYKQEEEYPEYSDEDINFRYSNANKTITIHNVTLQPNKNYRIKLIGSMTCTQEANISENYELVFRTK